MSQMSMVSISFDVLKQTARAKGYVVRWDCSEFRIAPKLNTVTSEEMAADDYGTNPRDPFRVPYSRTPAEVCEDLAYYTRSMDDAFDTLKSMPFRSEVL